MTPATLPACVGSARTLVCPCLVARRLTASVNGRAPITLLCGLDVGRSSQRQSLASEPINQAGLQPSPAKAARRQGRDAKPAEWNLPG